MRIWNVLLAAFITSTLFLLSSCLVESPLIGDEGGSTAVVDPQDDPVAKTRLICDPFNTNSQLGRERGLFGVVYYIPDMSVCHGGPNPEDGSGHGNSGDNGHGNDGDHGNSGDNGHGNDGDNGNSGDNGHSNDGDHGNSGVNGHGNDGDHGNSGDNGHGSDGDHGNSGDNGHGNSGNGNGHHKVSALSDDEGDHDGEGDDEHEDGGACFKNVEEYIQKGTLVDVNIYMDRLFVQSQPFTKGLVDSKGNTIDLAGVKFFENFAVDMDAQLQLASNEQPGLYQLAIISDDGALLKQVADDGSETIIVNNNGSHPTKMACADAPIYMDRSTKLKIKIQQYQGARKNISMIAMWRPYDPHNTEAVSRCGKRGNGYFFDSTKTPIKPKKPFYDLLVNGWKVLENENFEFPGQQDNPCAPKEAALLLTGFSITQVARSSVTVTWNSNIPGSGQIEVKNVTTGVITRSPVETSLAVVHTMNLPGLSPNTLYSVRAITNTPGGQTVFTDERAFRTPR